MLARVTKIVRYLTDCESMKCLVDDLVVTCDDIVDTPISLTDGINY